MLHYCVISLLQWWNTRTKKQVGEEMICLGVKVWKRGSPQWWRRNNKSMGPTWLSGGWGITFCTCIWIREKSKWGLDYRTSKPASSVTFPMVTLLSWKAPDAFKTEWLPAKSVFKQMSLENKICIQIIAIIATWNVIPWLIFFSNVFR